MNKAFSTVNTVNVLYVFWPSEGPNLQKQVEPLNGNYNFHGIMKAHFTNLHF
jgi:hypothetical protein